MITRNYKRSYIGLIIGGAVTVVLGLLWYFTIMT